MIFGNYPCCDGDLTLSVGDLDTPVIQREICPHCGALVWHKLSRFDPESWTDAEFREIYNVNDETKAVTLKGCTEVVEIPPALKALRDAAMDRAIQTAADSMADDLMAGRI